MITVRRICGSIVWSREGVQAGKQADGYAQEVRQNLPQNHMKGLAEVREIVRSGDYETMELLYDDIPGALSQLIRTAFVVRDGIS